MCFVFTVETHFYKKEKKIVCKTEPDEHRFYISHNSSVSDHSHFTSLLLYIHYDVKGEIIRYI